MYACLSSNPLWIIALIKGDPRTEWHKTIYYYTYLLSSIVIQDSRGASLPQIIIKYEKVAQSAGRGWYPAGYCDMWYLSLYNRIPHVTHFLLISQDLIKWLSPHSDSSTIYLVNAHLLQQPVLVKMRQDVTTIIPKTNFLCSIKEGSRAGGPSGNCHF